MRIEFPMEIEGKYRVSDVDRLMLELDRLGAVFQREESQSDTYLQHPCRDFRITDEALRIRVIDGVPFVTYKGPRREGTLKMRPEIEIPLGDTNMDAWHRIWQSLGFEPVATVTKTRRVYRMVLDGRELWITIDRVERVGCFAEIERVVQAEQDLEIAKADIEGIALQLGLTHMENRSYLSMHLELTR